MVSNDTGKQPEWRTESKHGYSIAADHLRFNGKPFAQIFKDHIHINLMDLGRAGFRGNLAVTESYLEKPKFGVEIADAKPDESGAIPMVDDHKPVDANEYIRQLAERLAGRTVKKIDGECCTDAGAGSKPPEKDPAETIPEKKAPRTKPIVIEGYWLGKDGERKFHVDKVDALDWGALPQQYLSQRPCCFLSGGIGGKCLTIYKQFGVTQYIIVGAEYPAKQWLELLTTVEDCGSKLTEIMRQERKAAAEAAAEPKPEPQSYKI